MTVKSIKPKNLFNECVTGDIWLCPCCGRKFRLLHRDYMKRKKKYGHRFEEIKGDFG